MWKKRKIHSWNHLFSKFFFNSRTMPLLSRNFCQNNVRVNFYNFHTVMTWSDELSKTVRHDFDIHDIRTRTTAISAAIRQLNPLFWLHYRHVTEKCTYPVPCLIGKLQYGSFISTQKVIMEIGHSTKAEIRNFFQECFYLQWSKSKQPTMLQKFSKCENGCTVGKFCNFSATQIFS